MRLNIHRNSGHINQVDRYELVIGLVIVNMRKMEMDVDRSHLVVDHVEVHQMDDH